MKIRQFILVVVCSLFISYCFGFTGGYNLVDEIHVHSLVTLDTIPGQDRYNDFITDDRYNPFDLQTKEVTQEVEYDPVSGNYFIVEKIGDEYFRSPSYMTFEEYLEWKAKKDEMAYFGGLAGITTGQKSDSGKVDPMSKIALDKALLDRMFGGNEITIEPQGNIDLTFGFDYIYQDGANIPLRSARQGPLPDFDMNIQINVDGKIGEKLNLGFNYDTGASFDFDRKIKLEYDTEVFSEDDIVKKIEAGNVSLPLRSNLIQGAQSLFGLKTELQFGRLRLTGLLSQQRSNQESLKIEGGALKQEFNVTPTEYDENRHFFLSYYHRNRFEESMQSIPYINSVMNIVNVEVWVSNYRNDNPSESRQIAALSDLGTTDEDLFHNMNNPGIGTVPTNRRDELNNILPDNEISNLYSTLQVDNDTRLVNNVPSNLKSAYNMQETRDFEIFRGRKLSPSEFTFHPQLGFISLNIRLRSDQVLAVAYEYTYTYCDDEVFKVGEPTDAGASSSVTQNGFDEEEIDVEPEKVIYTKLLKSSNQRVSLPSWDLMMKNVYPIGTSGMNQEDFKFDIFFEDNSDGSLKRFLPEPGFERQPLLNVFNLDRLNASLDPQPDGIFDYVEGLTINTRTGSVYFPVLEPFGSSLENILGPAAAAYQFQEIYDTTKVIAEQTLERNLFVMKGEYKSSVSSEISLGSWNLPQGSVKVTAGSAQLIEGVDYEVDYGIGRLRIINPSYLQSGTPINVTFEDNSLFSLQQKNMIGLRADYTFSENLNIGATYLKLKERPFTQKVNLGEDPINNRVFGLDFTYGAEADWVTKAVDKLPFYSTKEKSNINFTAEVAAIKPGHARGINLDGDGQPRGGVISIDDFEGAGSPIPLATQPNQWILASVPNYGPLGDVNGRFKEGALDNNIESGFNRALLNWYVIDRSFRTGADQQDPYTRTVDQRELFEREIAFQITDLFTFDLNFFPDERGPYNFEGTEPTDNSAGLDVDRSVQANGETLFLNNPEERWGGVMRYLQNNDFQTANVEYLDFWLLNPYMDRRDGSTHDMDENGELIFHLGNVSEDILNDNLQFFENSIPTAQDDIPVEETVWGEIPLRIPILDGFNINIAEEQDLGLDGLDDAGERAKYQDYLNNLAPIPTNSLNQDPANDDFAFITDPDKGFDQLDNLILRSKCINNPEGNYPDRNVQSGFVRGNPFPDKEDLNGNSSLNKGESFYEYRLQLENVGGELSPSTEYLRETKVISGGSGLPDEKWYRFQIPISEGDAINGIEGFRSIQFMRMLVTGFKSQKTFRFAEMEMVRNTWRRQPTACGPVDGVDDGVEFSLDDISRQENADKVPFKYRLPPGIKQEQVFNSTQRLAQDEKALALNICNLREFIPDEDRCEASIVKPVQLDMRVFDDLELFVHAEHNPSTPLSQRLNDKDLTIYIKMGKDFVNNYYEYEIPLYFSDEGSGPDDPIRAVPENIWLDSNKISFPLELFTDIKKLRNADPNVENIDRFERFLDPNRPDAKVTIKGLPSLGYIKGVEIGVRNNSEENRFCGEIWINELRVLGLQERAGLASEARLEVQMADLGTLTSSAGYSSIGWGALDKKVDERAKESILKYDVAADINLGKFFPTNWGLRVPFYAQFSRNIVTPEFDAYELDLTLDEVEDPVLARERSQEVETIRTFNFTNVRKEASKSKKKKGSKPKGNKPWNISNITASYSHTDTERKDFLIKEDKSRDQRLKLEYNYSNRASFIKPFKKVKGKWLRVIKEINFSPLPSSYYFNTEIRRFVNRREFREPQTPQFVFDDRRFTWDRNYGLKWDFFKNLKFNFDATNRAVIDELRQVGIADTPEDREWLDVRGDTIQVSNRSQVDDYWKENFMDFGRNKSYEHKFDVSYTAPLKYIPLTDWINVKARYNANYKWTASSLDYFDPSPVNSLYLGDVIENGQQRTVNATFSFDKIYKKSKFLKEIEKKKRRTKKKKETKDKKKRGDVVDKKVDVKKDPADRKKKKDKGPSNITRALVRPLLALRSVKFNYKEQLGTIVPGINQEYGPQMLGLSNGFDAPGWSFVTGLQPDLSISNSDNWLFKAARNGWITESKFLNNQVKQMSSQTYDARIAIEPYRDFKIDVDFKKQVRKDVFENFKNTEIAAGQPAEFAQLARREVGSFELTYSALKTMFNNDVKMLFDQFKENRINASAILNPGGAPHAEDGQVFQEGFGAVQSEVVIPSFLAAYTGRELNSSWVQRDTSLQTSSGLVYEVSRNGFLPRPNWTLRYNGLKKLPMFENVLSSFTLTHGYKSFLRVNQFRTNLDFDNQDPNKLNLSSGNYYSRFEIPLIQISEQFSPLIGIQMKTKKDFVLNVDYKKSRNLDLSTDVLGRLTEKKSSSITVGVGWTKPNVNIAFLTGDKKSKKKRKKKDDEKADDEKDKKDPKAQNNRNNRLGRGGVNNNRPRDLVFNIDFTLQDDVTHEHDYIQGIADIEGNRGQKVIRLNPSIDYTINENLTLRWFMDYETVRYVANPQLRGTTRYFSGFTARFTLN